MPVSSDAATLPSPDAFAPAAVAERVSKAGVTKSNLKFGQMLWLAILAGVFIGLGAEYCTLVITGSSAGFGLTKLIGGLAFSLGLILVLIAGAELFTGNNLLTMAWLDGRVSTRKLLINWGVVFAGNLIGSLALAGLMYLTRQWALAEYGVGVTALRIAADKCAMPFMTALARGVLCNLLVCLAVWLCFASRSVVDRIFAIVFPITAFVASGFEHSVANMYFIPYGLLLKQNSQILQAAGLSVEQLSHLNVNGFFSNLIPVTMGNLIGGGAMVGITYWFVYLRTDRRAEPQAEPASLLIMPVTRPLALLPGVSEMKTIPDQQPQSAILVYSFTIASGDMYYSEMNQRDIYVRDDPASGFHIWGEFPDGGSACTDLGEVLLEYAMSAAAQGDLPQAYRQMDRFGKRLGESLALQILRGTPGENSTSRAACALECVLEAMDVHFVVDQDGDELIYTLDFCPLCEKSERTGLSQVELAHHGLNALCHTMIRALDPEFRVRLPRQPGADRIFRMILEQAHESVG
jgi:formate transporter